MTKRLDGTLMNVRDDEFRQFARLPFVANLQSSATISASPDTLLTGDLITVSFSGISKTSATEWIGFYCPNDSDDKGYLDFQYVSGSSGQMSFNIWSAREEVCEFR